MAKKFGVEAWLLPACVALVERQAPLTYVEATKLGLDMTVLFSEAREKYIQQQQSGTSNSYNSWGQQQSETSKSWGGQQNGMSGLWGGQQSRTSSSWGKQPNKNTTQLVEEVLHIK